MSIIPLIMQQVNFAALHRDAAKRLDAVSMDAQNPFAILAAFGDPITLLSSVYPYGHAKHIFFGFRIMLDYDEISAFIRFLHTGSLTYTSPESESYIVTGTLDDFMYAILYACEKNQGITRIGNQFYLAFTRTDGGTKVFADYQRIEEEGYFLLKRRCQ